jgi:hypothetical protein
MGRHLPPDHSRGDERTIGGYAAVHGRPAAFEGSDGLSYSVEIETDETGEQGEPFGAFLLFVRWERGDPRIGGHLETDFLERAPTAEGARSALGAWPLDRVKGVLDALLRERMPRPGRPWWEVMREEGGEDDDAGAGHGGA